MFTRRDFIRIGALSTGGLSLSTLLQSRAIAADKAPRAKACIVIWLDGGPSHLDLFDPKPEAPVEVRGPFAPIATDIAGVQLTELMPKLAQRLKHVALVRSLTSPLGEHNFGTQYLLTGYRPTPALEYPTFGSIVAHQRRDCEGVLPKFIAVPDFAVGGSRLTPQGYLSSEFAPLEIRSDPAKPDFRVDNLTFYPGVDAARLARRKEYLEQFARFEQAAEPTLAIGSPIVDPALEQAYRLLTSPEAKQAFELTAEPAKLRQAYGPRTIGQSCLLARRLVERGVPLVFVNYTGWDTHQQLITRLKEGYTGAKIPVGLAPNLDLALGALIDDLRDRGLWDSTLVVVMGEFGRTPKLNTDGGRDHWPRVFSALVGGAGVPGGQIVGKSDAHGESPADRPVTPADLMASLVTLLGIDPKTKLITSDNRPVSIVDHGEALPELVG
jgi:uncharacterized protein (DUF1501 family)